MDKRRAIQIMTKAAQLYKEHLEDQKVLFLYGLPKEVNKQLQESNKILSSVQGYEVVFHRIKKRQLLQFIFTRNAWISD